MGMVERVLEYSLVLLPEALFFDRSTSMIITVATGQMDDEAATAISNDMLEADRKFTKAHAEWAKVQARYK